MLPERTRNYLILGLEGSPIVLERLLRSSDDAACDRRPDPERFTVREVMAHLADWEGVWLERMTRMRTQAHPTLLGYDEGEWAIAHDYAHLDVADSLAKFRAGRADLTQFLRSLAPEEWERTGLHAEQGPLTIADLATLIISHDGYHSRQLVEWLA